MNSLFKKRLIVEAIVVACAAPFASADSLVLPTTPLITASAVEPNLMLLIDSSGSMSNIVQETPYDEDTAYFTCVNKLTGASKVINTHIVDGAVKVKYDGTDYTFGNGVGDKCFNDTSTYTRARLYANSSNNTTVGNYGYGSYKGHYLNWYFNTATGGFADGKKENTSTRMQIAKIAAKEMIDGLDGIRVGLAQYNGSAGAEILVDIDNLDAQITDTKTQADLLKDEIGDDDTGIQNSGSTPLAESFQDLGWYFTKDGTGDLNLHDGEDNEESCQAQSLFEGSGAISSSKTVIQYWCQKNFIVAMTDGVPSGGDGISGKLQVYSSAADGVNVVKAIYETDLRPDFTKAKNNVSSYIIGFADESATSSALLSDMAKAGSDNSDYLTATNSTDLGSAFSSAAKSIFAKVASWSAVSFNSSSISTDSELYMASFNTAAWNGSLKAYKLSATTGDVATNASWDAATVLDAEDMDYTARKIFTYNNAGVEFTKANLDSTQLDDLKQGPEGTADASVDNLINYIKGDRSKEGSGSTNYRTRSSRLGDIVNSSSVYVGAPKLDWSDENEFGADDDSYADFKSGIAADRTPMIYVGANDGMLHGFEADSGTEKFAYIPGSIFSDSAGKGLHYLAEQNYAHQFYVDLTPTVSDVYINSAWRSVLIGGLRAGGKGLFALDITTPNSFAAADVLWEFSSADDPDFGYSYSQPTVTMMENDKWAVITGNGYNNDGSGTAQLFILFIEEGTDGSWDLNGDSAYDYTDPKDYDYIKIDTGVGDADIPNGLSTPTVVDTDGDGIADRIYAGDLQGNMWAFDVSDGDEKKWEVAYEWKTAKTPAPIFTALNDSGDMQPVTSAPTVTTNPSEHKDASDLLVLFGTGKYLEASDVSGNKQVMSYYAIGDDEDGSGDIKESEKKTRKNDLDERELTTASGLRSISGLGIDWKNKSGWYVDLPSSGERVISNSLVSNSILFFNTIIPEGSACSSGGESWLMSVDLGTGLAPTYGIFDANGDKSIDKATADTDTGGDGVNDNDTGYIGQSFNNGLASQSNILSNVQYTVGSTGIISKRDINTGVDSDEGRLSWQELIRD